MACDLTPIKLPKEVHWFRHKQGIPKPTNYALILGGYLIDQGYSEVLFEAKFDQLHVDIYLPDLEFIFEVFGKRLPEQSKKDSNRDGFLVASGNYFIQRISNEAIELAFTPQEQFRYHLAGSIAYCKQLKAWYTNSSVPDFLNGVDDNVSSFNSLSSDEVIQWFSEAGGVDDNVSSFNSLSSDEVIQWLSKADGVN